MGYSQGVKAPVFDTGTAGSNPAIPAMIRYSRGSRGQSAKLLIAGSNPARISSGESPQTIRYQLERLSPDFRSVTEQLKLVTFHKVPSSSRLGRQPLRLAKSRLQRLLACIAPAGAYQAGNTGSSPVGITNHLDILELTTSQLFDFVGNHSHGFSVGVNFYRFECVVQRYSCYTSFNYILKTNAVFHILS